MNRLWHIAHGKLRRVTYLVPTWLSRRVKGKAESLFWKGELDRYVRWYNGGAEFPTFPPPTPEQQVTGHTPTVNAVVTFVRTVQFPRYRHDLDLAPDALRGKRVLDIGCGPLPGLLAFEGCEPHGVDPLVDRYRQLGYPLELWTDDGFRYHSAPAEAMPFPDDHFDAVVSVNAVDHVDDFGAVADEIRRVLRPDGLLRLQINYHPPTVTEPVSLDDATVRAHYGWATGLEKLRDEAHSEEGERLTLWSSAGP